MFWCLASALHYSAKSTVEVSCDSAHTIAVDVDNANRRKRGAGLSISAAEVVRLAVLEESLEIIRIRGKRCSAARPIKGNLLDLFASGGTRPCPFDPRRQGIESNAFFVRLLISIGLRPYPRLGLATRLWVRGSDRESLRVLDDGVTVLVAEWNHCGQGRILGALQEWELREPRCGRRPVERVGVELAVEGVQAVLCDGLVIGHSVACADLVLGRYEYAGHVETGCLFEGAARDGADEAARERFGLPVVPGEAHDHLAGGVGDPEGARQ